MKPVTPELEQLLNTTRQFRMAELLTINLVGGATLRYTAGDVRVLWGGNTFEIDGPLWQRGEIRAGVGLEPDTLSLTFNCADRSVLLAGVPFIASAIAGALDGAECIVERAFFSTVDYVLGKPAGTVQLFSGRVSKVQGSRFRLAVTVASWLELLNTKLPRNTYAPGCHRTLYSPGCGVSKAAKTVAGTVTAAISRSVVDSALAQADGYFNLGTLVFNSGANAGISRTVKRYASGEFTFILPLPYDPVVGDTFSVYPGCDKTQATCQGRFANIGRFGGTPYIPAPETIT